MTISDRYPDEHPPLDHLFPQRDEGYVLPSSRGIPQHPEKLRYSSEQYEIEVGLQSHIADIISGTHMWDEINMINHMTDQGISPQEIDETLDRLRDYRIAMGYTITFDQNRIYRCLGSKDAIIFADIDLANLDVVIRRINKSRIPSNVRSNLLEKVLSFVEELVLEPTKYLIFLAPLEDGEPTPNTNHKDFRRYVIREKRLKKK